MNKFTLTVEESSAIHKQLRYEVYGQIKASRARCRICDETIHPHDGYYLFSEPFLHRAGQITLTIYVFCPACTDKLTKYIKAKGDGK